MSICKEKFKLIKKCCLNKLPATTRTKTSKERKKKIHSLCFISNLYEQWFFRLVLFFENLSNPISPFEKLKQHQ